MAAAQHQRNGGLFHAGNQLGDGKPGFHISADGVEQNHQSFNGGVLLDGNQLRNDVFVLGGLILWGQDIVPLNLPNDGQAVDDVFGFCHGDRAGLDNLVGLLVQLVCFLLLLGAGKRLAVG